MVLLSHHSSMSIFHGGFKLFIIIMDSSSYPDKGLENKPFYFSAREMNTF